MRKYIVGITIGLATLFSSGCQNLNYREKESVVPKRDITGDKDERHPSKWRRKLKVKYVSAPEERREFLESFRIS